MDICYSSSWAVLKFCYTCRCQGSIFSSVLVYFSLFPPLLFSGFPKNCFLQNLCLETCSVVIYCFYSKPYWCGGTLLGRSIVLKSMIKSHYFTGPVSRDCAFHRCFPLIYLSFHFGDIGRPEGSRVEKNVFSPSVVSLW